MYSDYYDGSRIFLWLADYIGISVDKVNFFVCQIIALALASILRTALHPSKTTAAARHIYGLVFGLILGYFCFGRQSIHLAALPTSCYIVIRTTNPRIMQRTMLAVSLSYLSLIHIHRQVYDYASYSLDITGPLMVITQKVTCLAFSIHDGFTKTSEEMTTSQKQNAITKIPSFLEFFGFTLQFQTLMAGPVYDFKDYIDFIHGNSLPTLIEKKNGQNEEIIIEPSPMPAVVKKVFTAILCTIIYLTFIQIFPVEKIKEPEFLENTSLVQKLLYLYICTTPVRFKYYLAWMFADSICNMSGLGYKGVKDDGTHDWDKYKNVNILQFEFGSNFRESISAWNISTNNWLRFIVYERTNEKYAVFLTYIVSAVWHGFYPGYYITFLTGAIFTKASRTLRKTVRNYFMTNAESKLFYDVLTTICTRILIGYIVFPFVILEFWSSIRLYMHMYWCLHIIGFLSILLVPIVVPEPPTGAKNSIVAALSHAGPITNGISSP